MFTLEEKRYLLQLLKAGRFFFLFRRTSKLHRQLTEKLEQMIRNEEVNAR